MEYKLIDVKREDLLAIQILGENNLNTSLVYKKNLLRDLLFSNDHILLKLVKNKEIIGIIICSLIPSENRIHIKYFLIDKNIHLCEDLALAIIYIKLFTILIFDKKGRL